MDIKRKELKVSAIRNGTVIDHIPSDKSFQVIKILNLDTSNKQIYLSNAFSIESLFPADPRRVADDQAGFNREAPVHDMGRVDVSAMGIGDVRKVLLHTRDKNNPEVEMARRRWFADDFPYTGNADLDVTWHDVLEDELVLPGLAGDLERGTQRYLLKTLMSWPRVERTPPGPARYDQALTNSILGSACSSFIVEWTWDDNVGETRTWKVNEPANPASRRTKVTWQGFRYDPAEASPNDLPNAGTMLEPDASGSMQTRLRQKGDLFWFGKHLPTDVPTRRCELFDLVEDDLAPFQQVIFLAGLSNDPMAEFNPAKNFVQNGALPSYLAYIAKNAGVERFVYASSCSVYGFTDDLLADEDSEVRCGYPYGISKLQGERRRSPPSSFRPARERQTGQPIPAPSQQSPSRRPPR